jgi:hypothetical protein
MASKNLSRNRIHFLVLSGQKFKISSTVLTIFVLELLNSWGAAIGCGRAKEAWRLVPLCLL